MNLHSTSGAESNNASSNHTSSNHTSSNQTSSSRTAPINTLSIIVPILDEQDNVEELNRQIAATCDIGRHPYEIIYVNDGSTDKTPAILDRLAQENAFVKVIHFKRNFGQTAAMMAGIDHATGDVLITLDADLQNDPKDIPALLAKLDEGYDLVSGWRKDRQDAKYKRIFVSRLANRLISRLSDVHLNDYGCTLKAYRKEILEDVKLYGEMHRFIPIYAAWSGATITEIPVSHHARSHGKSHYGLERTFKVLLDLMVILFLHRYAQKPIYVFGGCGLLNFFFAFLTFVFMLFLKYAHDTDFIQTPLPIITVMFFLVGMISLLLGLIAELLMRTYFESQHKRSYIIKRQ